MMVYMTWYDLMENFSFDSYILVSVCIDWVQYHSKLSFSFKLKIIVEPSLSLQ